MAPLPPERCNLSHPFQVTGIDFAGPFELKTSSLRKSPYIKGYVSVFVCFSTKAVHLEPCSDLSSAAFHAAFSRFVGRRGLPQRVVTDNGKNFLGCSRALELEFSTFIKNVVQDIAQKYITHGFEWKFIPPHAPHMGGLWEAAVKSFKFHFKRIAGPQKFTFEEFATVLARIEGVLNSRPISALSEDPTDLTALTPGHFLRGAPLMAFPEPSFQDLSLINRWEKLKALHHQFSIRWKEEYLKYLHKRYKWRNSAPNIQVGDLVVVIDDLLPPHEWRLGRIEETFPGSDKNIRTANEQQKARNYPSNSIGGNQATNRVRRRNQDNYKCDLCHTSHALRFCRKFLKMSTKKREEVVEKHRYCSNCLARSHDLRACSSTDTCRVCDRYHHTLLHPRRRRSHHPNGIRHRHQQNHRQTQPQPTNQTLANQKPTKQQPKLTATSDTKIIVEAIRS